MSDILNGNRVNLPRWEIVMAFVEACGAAAAEISIDPRELVTLPEWKRHWEGAFNLHSQPDLDEAAFADWRRRWNVVFNRPVQEARSPEASSALVAGGGVRSSPPVRGRMPSRLTDFAGRADWLARLHEALASQDRVGQRHAGQGGGKPVAIQGLCGIGKSQLAVEYAHRYAGDYDLMWWVPCDDLKAAHAAMADLEQALNLADANQAGHGDQADREGGLAGLLDVLSSGQECGRWLLVFDNADDPDEIKHLIPSAGGHVLVTSRNSQWGSVGVMLELSAFTRDESVEFLRRHMPILGMADAHRLAEAAGDLPLILECAAASRMMIDDYLAQLTDDPLALLDSQPPDYPMTAASQWRGMISRLRDSSPEAMSLLSFLAFFGSEPIHSKWLERYQQGMSVYALLRDQVRRERAIATLVREGLLRVRADDRAEGQVIGVHEMTRLIVRNIVARNPADAERYRTDVHLLLAAADPLYPNDPLTWRSYDELRGHATASGIESSSDEGVRTLVINLVRSLVAAGYPGPAVSQADRALRQWASGSDAFLTMGVARAAALLACDRRRDAFQSQLEMISAIQDDPDRWESGAVYRYSMIATQCRFTGAFADAQEADRASLDIHTARFGRDDPQTIRALNSVIADLTLCGEYGTAVSEAESVIGASRNLYPGSGHPAVLFQRNTLARCLWLSGRYDDSFALMADVHAGFQDLAERGILHERHPWRLAHEVDFAVIGRDAAGLDGGAVVADLETLATGLREVWRRCWRSLGERHPQTLVATVTLASILRRIPGRTPAAIALLSDAERRYRDAFPGHPFTHACQGYVAAARRPVTGDPAGLATDLRDAVNGLTDTVGPDHPLTLGAIHNLANVLAEAGELDAALLLGQRALAGFRGRLDADHPHSRTCEANLAAIAARQEDGQQEMLIDIDFTPLPL